MSQRKTTYSVPELVRRLRDMDKQIICGSDIFSQCADKLEELQKEKERLDALFQCNEK